MNSWPIGKRVGILGGGQLARMLAHSAQSMGFEVHVLCPDSSEPAAQVIRHHHLGQPSKRADLEKFLSAVDVVTFESEFFDMSLIQEVAAKKSVQFFPAIELMQILQDRLTQKQLLEKHKIPTAPFTLVQTAADLERAWELLRDGFVLKKTRGGYDGNGTFYARVRSDVDVLAADFPGICIAEGFVRFKRELASIAVCGEKELHFLPLTESKQTQSRCDWVSGPTLHKAWPEMQKKLRRLLKKINYRGVIAFEFFDTGAKLLVNEIAPRVHNSGHYSMDALTQSQFDLHWIAGLGLRFVEPRALAKTFVMTNLIGEGQEPFQFPAHLGGKLHWYEKKTNRAGRKMGHLNYVGNDSAALLMKALRERKRIHK